MSMSVAARSAECSPVAAGRVRCLCPPCRSEGIRGDVCAHRDPAGLSEGVEVRDPAEARAGPGGQDAPEGDVRLVVDGFVDQVPSGGHAYLALVQERSPGTSQRRPLVDRPPTVRTLGDTRRY